MSVKAIAKVWTFRSSSSDKTYETLYYTDGRTSCDCPGWTRRVDANGHRTCRHTRLVDLGRADSEAINCHEYAAPHDIGTGRAHGLCPHCLHFGSDCKCHFQKNRKRPPTLQKNRKRPPTLSTPVLAYGNRKLCL